MMRKLFAALLYLLVSYTCISLYADNTGQSVSKPNKKTNGAMFNDSMFQLAVESGGDYYFWIPGEFASYAEKIPPQIFLGTNKSPVLKEYGTLDNEETIFPFLISHDTKNFTLFISVQFDPIISLTDPSGNPITEDNDNNENNIVKTSHMLMGYIDSPENGEWKVTINGSGKYSVTVNPDIPIKIEHLIELPHNLSPDEATDYYLEKFYTLERENGWDLIRSLPEEKMVDIARRLLSDNDPLVSYIAAGILIRNGFEEETIPIIADIILSSKEKRDLNNRLGYDWVHSDDENLAARMFIKILEYINHHYKDLQPDEKKIAAEFFHQMGLYDEYSYEKADLLISKYRSRMQIIKPDKK